MNPFCWVLTTRCRLASFAARSFDEAVGSGINPAVDLGKYRKRPFDVTQQAYDIESADYRTILAWHRSEIEAFGQVRRSNAPEC